tara:strand:+ start:559 stop:717 length:159 start_codon:yes stop_codon:yes gene_type:complete
VKKGVDFFGDSAILFSASGGRPAQPKKKYDRHRKEDPEVRGQHHPEPEDPQP